MTLISLWVFLLWEQMKKIKFLWLKSSEPERLPSCEPRQLRLSLFVILSRLSTVVFSQSADTRGRLLMKCLTLLPSLSTGISSEEMLLSEAKSLKYRWRALSKRKGSKGKSEKGGPFKMVREPGRQGSRPHLSPAISSLSMSRVFPSAYLLLLFPNLIRTTSELSRACLTTRLWVGGKLLLGYLWGWQRRANLGIDKRGLPFQLLFPLRAPWQGSTAIPKDVLRMSFRGNNLTVQLQYS